MRLLARPEGLLEHLALWLNLGPSPIVLPFFGMMGSRAAMAGVKLGLYAQLAKGPATATELASRLELDPSSTRLLLESLCGLGLLSRSRGGYRLKRRAAKWLDPSSSSYIGGFIDFNYDQWEIWSSLEESVRKGRGVDLHRWAADDPRWERYLTAMFQLGRLSAPEVAAAIPVPRASRLLLDLAGGHGVFAAELCRRHPGLLAQVIDLPPAVRVGRKLIAGAGLGDRVVHLEGNLLTDALPGPSDVVLCFQILHHFTEDENRELLKKVAGSLRPGGVLAILEYLEGELGRTAGASALIGLHYFLSSTAKSYSRSEVSGWLAQAGLTQTQVRKVRRIPLQTLLIARKG